MSKLEKVKKEARKFYEYEDWNFHILKVLKYSLALRKQYKADKTVVELSVYLHDMARSTRDSETHHIEGAKLAEQILKKHHYPEKTIDAVKHCVISHRSSKEFTPKTIEARIVANADALSHFDMLPLFFHWRAKKGSFIETVEWVDKKLKRDWETKLTLPQSKKLVKQKYADIKLLLKEFK